MHKILHLRIVLVISDTSRYVRYKAKKMLGVFRIIKSPRHGMASHHSTGFSINKLLTYFPPKILYFITKDINLSAADGVW